MKCVVETNGAKGTSKYFSSEKGMKNRMAVVFLLQPLIKSCVLVDVCKCEKYPVVRKGNGEGKKQENLSLHSCNDNISFAIRSEAQLEHDENLQQPEKMLNKRIIRKYQAAQIRITNS